MNDIQILFAHSFNQFEDDCACATTPDILTNQDQNAEFEQDCACPSPVSRLITTGLENGQKWQRIQGLFRAQLEDSFTLLYDPLGRAPLTVLNEGALSVLDAFETPLCPKEASSRFSQLSSSNFVDAARRMIRLGLLEAESILTVKPNDSRPHTLTAWLHVTNECNLRCDYCYIYKTPERMSFERGKQSVDAVFRSAVAQSFRQVKLKYAGGESTLEFNLILQLHDYAKEEAHRLGLGLIGVVLSNGIGISDQMIDSLHSRALRLSISIDGIGATHDLQRKFKNGKGSFALVERSLDRLARQNFKPSITVTVSQRNADGLPQVIEYLLERELPFTINFYRENEQSASFEDLAYQDEKMISAMKAAFVKIEAHLPAFSILGAITDRARLDMPHQQPCGVGHSYMVIDQNGNVAKCHMEIKKKVTDITVSDPLKVLQLDKSGIQNLSVEEKEGCRSCEWRYYCAGGCPALTYRVTGRYDVKSPNCRIYKALFPEVLRLEGLRLLKYANDLEVVLH